MRCTDSHHYAPEQLLSSFCLCLLKYYNEIPRHYLDKTYTIGAARHLKTECGRRQEKKMTRFLTVLIGATLGVSVGMAQPKTATKYETLKTDAYSIEIPKGWKVSPETFFGQRKVKPSSGRGELGLMTAPPSRQSWQQLYQTSLFYILREEKGKATPYKLTKTKRGYEAATFDVVNKDGFNSRRYVLIKHPEKGLLAISVSIPEKSTEIEWAKHFKRMVDTATFS